MPGMYVQDSSFVPVGYEQITVTTSAAVGFTAGTLKEANFAVIKVNGSIRFRDDGVNPTTSVGFPWGTNDPVLVITLEDMSAFKMISTSGSHTAEVLYYIR